MKEDVEDLVYALESLLGTYAKRKLPAIRSGEIIFTSPKEKESSFPPELAFKFFKDLSLAVSEFEKLIIEKYDACPKSGPAFPRKWMKEGKGQKVIDRCKWLCPLLTYLYERTRSYTRHGWTMKDLVGDAKHKDRYPYTAFRTDKAFWDEIINKVSIKTTSGTVEYIALPTARKYIAAFSAAGFIIEHAEHGPQGKIYIDGYYQTNDGQPAKKQTILKNSPELRKSFLEFKVRT